MAMKIQVLGAALGGMLSMSVVGDALAAGSVNASYGAVADSGVGAFITSFGFNFAIPEPEVVPGPLQFVIDAAKKLCNEEEVYKLERELDELEDTLVEIEIELDTISAELRDLDVARGMGDLAPSADLIAAETRRLESEQVDLSSALAVLEEKILDAEDALADARKKCDDSEVSAIPSSNIFANLQTAGGITLDETFITSFADGGSGIPGASAINSVIGDFSLADPKADNPWAIFLSSSLTGLDDDRTGADRRARILNVAVGGKIRVDPKTTLGFTGGYSRGEVTSDANASKVTGDYFSATLSGDYLLKEALTLGLATTYTRGENTLEIGGGTGDFDFDVFGISASLSGPIKQGEYVITPRLSAGISQVRREGHTDSLGIIVPGSEVTHGNVNLGASVSRTFLDVDGFRSIAPSVSLGSSYLFRDDFDVALTSGTIAEEIGLGASLGTGLNMQFDDGMGVNVGGAYGLFQDDVEIWSLSARLVKRF